METDPVVEMTKLSIFAAILFGAVVGVVTFRILRRSGDGAAISDIGAIIGAIAGPTVTGLFAETGLFAGALFSWYVVAFGLSFFLYWIAYIVTGDDWWAELRLGKNPKVE